MEIVLTIGFALLGTAVGSFLNVCVDRLPAGRSIVYPPSHCEACKNHLSLIDLIPVFSYVLLRGRCRYCQTHLPRRLLWVEVAGGVLFAFSYWHYGLSAEFAVVTLYCCIFLVLSVIDLEHRLILNKIVFPAAGAVLVIDFIMPPGVISGLIGAGIGFVFLMIPALLYPDGMGWGDVKMAGFIGLAIGFPLVFVSLFTGIIVGGLMATVMLLFKLKKRRDAIPFGPFLALGAVVTLFWGESILGWYLTLF